MAKKRHFEDLVCWQKARLLTNAVYYLTSKSSFGKDNRLRDQIQAAAGSAMHNIAAGNDAGTDLEFIRFLKFARRSCSEVQSELYLAMDRKYVTADELAHAYELADEVKRLVNGLISYLRKTGQVGSAKIQESQADSLAQGRKGLPDDLQGNLSQLERDAFESHGEIRHKPSPDEINYYRPNDYDPGASEPGESETKH